MGKRSIRLYATNRAQDFDHELDRVARTRQIYETIDRQGFQWIVVFVAGIGFFLDGYTLFASNIVLPMISYVYWHNDVTSHHQSNINIATLAGTMIGQLVFGILADKAGRKKMYGIELMLVIAATLGVAMSSTGANNSMDIVGWLLFWRIVVGFGVGADYPLSAVITSEFAPTKHRARMMASVFFMQPLGQITCNLVSLIVILRVRNQHLDDSFKAVDIIWRWVIGIGVIPGIVALLFRIAIPETPRFLLEVEHDPVKAVFDADYLFGEIPALAETTELGTLNSDGRQHAPSSVTSMTASNAQQSAAGEGSSVKGTVAHGNNRSPPNSVDVSLRKESIITLNTITQSMQAGMMPLASHLRESTFHWPPSSSIALPEDAQTSPTLNSSWSLTRSDIRRYFITAGNWRSLAGLSICWFLQDFAFYGIGLSNPQFLAKTWGRGALDVTGTSPIWQTTTDPNVTIYDMLMNTSIRALVILNVGSFIGGLLYIALIPYVNRHKLQAYGFLFLAALFITLGAVLITLQKNGPVAIVLYVIGQIAFNFGPNGTTYTLPGELFPTRYRASCHGISAAAGKLGSIAVQIFSAYYSFGASSANEEKVKLYGRTLVVFSALMIIGSLVTFAWVPDVQDKSGNSKTLEELSKGRQELSRSNVSIINKVRTWLRFSR